MKKSSGSQFEQSLVIEKRKVRLNKPVMLVGLPGIGLVSKLAADNVVRTTRGARFASLYSKHFPNQVLALANGKLRMFGVHLYACRVGKRDVVVVKGDLQPFTVEGQHEVSSRLLSYFHSLGGTTVLAMAGYAINRVVDKPKVFVSSTSKKLLKKLSSCGATTSGNVVPIVGMAGLMPALSKLHGMAGSCLLVETPGSVVDAKGAIAISDVLSKFLGAKIETKELNSRADKAAKLMQKFEAQQAKAIEQQPVPKQDELTYIR